MMSDDGSTTTPPSRPARSGSASGPAVYRRGLHRTDGPAPRRWVTDDGSAVTEPTVLDRLRRLAVPPAWTGVWASLEPDSPVQAIGVDSRGRTQYRYSARTRAEHDADKFAHVVLLAEALPRIRDHVASMLAGPVLAGPALVSTGRAGGEDLERSVILAAMVRLLDRGFFRVGNDRYVRDNHTYGLTTLRRDQVRVDGSRLHFDYVAKHHLHRITDLDDPDVAAVVRGLLDRSGDGDGPLFVMDRSAGTGEHGGPIHVTSSVVNSYLHGLGGAPATAKAFRTWSGTVVAAAVLGGAVLDPAAPAKTGSRRSRSAGTTAVAAAATLLGNTPAVARASYVHPQVLAAANGARRGTFDDTVGEAVDRAAGRLGTRSVTRIWLEPDVQRAVRRLLRDGDLDGPDGDGRGGAVRADAGGPR